MELIHTPRTRFSRRCTCGRWFVGYPSEWALAEAVTRHTLQEHR